MKYIHDINPFLSSKRRELSLNRRGRADWVIAITGTDMAPTTRAPAAYTPARSIGNNFIARVLSNSIGADLLKFEAAYPHATRISLKLGNLQNLIAGHFPGKR